LYEILASNLSRSERLTDSSEESFASENAQTQREILEIQVNGEKPCRDIICEGL